jgi:hypothetical protein
MLNSENSDEKIQNSSIFAIGKLTPNTNKVTSKRVNKIEINYNSTAFDN